MEFEMHDKCEKCGEEFGEHSAGNNYCPTSVRTHVEGLVREFGTEVFLGKPDLATELARLYDREQNVKIWSDWDAQWNVALGDDLNGYTEEERGLTLEGVAEWLSKRGRE